MTGADLTGARLGEARFYNATKWPDGFDPQAAGAIYEDPEGFEDLFE